MEVVRYCGVEYYFVSDICIETGMQRSYLYRLLKQKKLHFLEKEGIKLIEKESLENYLSGRKKNSDKTNLIKKIKVLDENKIQEIKKIVDKL